MKNKILALVLSLALVLTSIPLFAFAADTTVTNVDGSTESFKYDETLFDLGTDSKGATTLIRKSDGYVFYPNTHTNIGLADTLDDVTVPKDSDGLELNKAVTQYPIYPNGEYTITLEAFTTGEVTVEQKVIPTDIILVLDQSGSMYQTFGDKDTNVVSQTRQYAMKNAVNAFISSVNDSATKDKDGNMLDSSEYVDHRIAIVTYENRTHILSGNGTNASAFSTVYEDSSTLTNTINNLPETKGEAEDKLLQGNESNLQTATHLGMTTANDILAADSVVQGALNNSNPEEQRNTVVVLFSDGVPAKSGSITYDGKSYTENKWHVFTEYSAHEAINQSYKTKTDYNATVFSIGIVTGADKNVISGAKDTGGNQLTGVGEDWSVVTYNDKGNAVYSSQNNIAAINRFFNFLSSNSSDAQNLGAIPTGRNNNNSHILGWEITNEYEWSDQEYYLTADNSEDLNEAFSGISNNVSSETMDLPATTQVKDFVSDYFKMPEGFYPDSDVTVYEVKSTGGTVNADGSITYTWDNVNKYQDITDDVTITYEPDKKGVNITGFDFKENFVSATDKNVGIDGEEEDYGSKLVIQFNVEATDGFIGGNDVVTNTTESGVYNPETGTVVDKFTPPNTNVIVDYDITTDDKVIYLGNQVMIYDILELNHVQVEGILNQFVNIQFAIYSDGALDANGDFAQKLTVDGAEYTVYKKPDKYWYYNDSNVKTYTDEGGQYRLSSDGTEVLYVDENGDEHEIEIEDTGYCYYKENKEILLTPTQAKDYDDLIEATFYIPASLSAEDASKLTFNQNNISLQPGECTDYDLRCYAVPNSNDEDSRYLAEQLNQVSTNITVHVIQPQISGNDIWIDYDEDINVKKDGTSSTIWGGNTVDPEEDKEEQDHYGDHIKHSEVTTDMANTETAPELFYIYKDIQTGICYKLPYGDEVIGTVHNDVATGDGDTISYKISSLDILDIKSEKNYEIVGVQTISSDGATNVRYWNCENGVHDKDATNNDINVYLNKYDVDIQKTVTVTESEWEHYKQSFIFEVAQDVNGTTNTTEVVMDPNDFVKSATAVDGKYTYTWTKTVKDLYASLDATVTEDTDWSWRYTLNSATFDDVVGGTISGNVSTDNVITVNYKHIVNKQNKVDTTGEGKPDATVAEGTNIYINDLGSLVFINDANPDNGNVDTFFVNALISDEWLSHDDVKANEFDELTPIESEVTATGGVKK